MRVLGARPVCVRVPGPPPGWPGSSSRSARSRSYEYDKAGKYLTANVSLWPRPLVLFASRKAWAALTPAERRVLRQAVTGDRARRDAGRA